MYNFTKIIGINVIADLIDSCASMTITYDESHDITHHTEVLKNAFKIIDNFVGLKSMYSPEDVRYLINVVCYVCMLHDTVDHKYPVQLEENNKMLEDLLKKKFNDSWKDVLWIIKNMSYTTEIKNGYPKHSNALIQLARDICSDADKLEAIGKIGIQRCFIYNTDKNPNLDQSAITQIIIAYCHEKLLHLKDKFIRTGPGKEFAIPRHAYIEQFVETNGSIHHE